MNVQEYAARIEAIRAEVARVLVGQDEIVEAVLVAVFARGHVLIEGAPGLGKTLLVRTLGQVLGCSFRRVQFTPDLMPSDITGGNVFDQKSNAFVFHPGPLFAQLVLADEINRAPAKTQAALLEAMQEASVTADGVTRPLPRPFFVLATQNPIESQGTYPLPEAQLDRFLVKLNMRVPTREAERQMLANHVAGFDSAQLERVGLRAIVSAEEVLAMQQLLTTVHVEEAVLDYITDLVARTRTHRAIAFGASPRAAVALLGAARAVAAAAGREFVVPDDIKQMAPAVLRHRLLLQPDAELEGVLPDECVDEILREAAVPRTAAA